MAQHTITIIDEEGGVSVRMEGNGPHDTTAGIVAKALSHLIPKLMVDAAKKAAELGNCPCQACADKRNATAQTESSDSKPTLH